MNKSRRSFLVVGFLLMSSGSWAAASLKFGDELLQRGQFQPASIEFQRALVESADLADANAGEIADKALQSLWLSRDYKASAELAEYYSRKHSSHSRIECVSRYYLGLSYYGLKAYPRSRSELELSIKHCPEPINARAQYWTGLTALRSGDYANARASFESIGVASTKYSDAQVALKSIVDAERAHVKSPRRAGLLNVLLPGAGYAYAGYPQTGVASFLTIGLFTWGTVAAAQKGEPALAILLGSLNAAWYFGGVQGASNAARRTNATRLNAVVKPLEVN